MNEWMFIGGIIAVIIIVAVLIIVLQKRRENKAKQLEVNENDKLIECLNRDNDNEKV